MKLTILGDGQPFLGVNVPHLDCVGCGLSAGKIVDVVVRSVVQRERNSSKASLVCSAPVVERNPRVVRRLATDWVSVVRLGLTSIWFSAIGVGV